MKTFAKYLRVLFLWVLIALFFPMVKDFYDTFTAPITGLLVTAGVDDWTLAIITAIPWAIPFILFVLTIYYLSKKDEPEISSTRRIIFPWR